MGMMNNGLSYWQAETEGIYLLDLTLGDLLDQRAEEDPSQEAIVYSCYPAFGDALNIRCTYKDYRIRANAVAKGLLALGLNKGDHIAVWAPNLPERPILMMAAAKAGLVLVTINPLLQATEVEYILKQGEVTSERLQRLRFLCPMGMPPSGLLEREGWRPALLSEVSAAGSQVSDTKLAERQTSVSPPDPAILMYTSGTTGLPKGALLTHYGLVNNAVIYAERLEPFALSEWLGLQELRGCSWFPFFHVAGIVTGLLAPHYAGSTTYPLLAYDPVKAIQIISRERCIVAIGVSTMIQAPLTHPDVAHYDLSSLKVVGSGGAPVPLCGELSADGQWQGAEVRAAQAGHQSAGPGERGEDQNSISRSRS
jgi:acyl-CoA synthetase (AMP-forming)/AMP-acid ligase II